jgi:hypothetical protein
LTPPLRLATLPAVERRTFLALGVGAAALGAGTYAWLRAKGYAVDPPLPPGGGDPRAPTAALPGAPYPAPALATLAPLLEVLLPGDPDLGLPSAGEAGVLEFLTAASRAPGLTPVRNDILKLTRFLDQQAQGLAGVRFSALTDPDERRRVVAEAAEDATPRGRFVPAQATEVTLRLALEGYLGHPFHGGNRDARVWQALSIDMPRDRAPAHIHGAHP